SWMVQNVCPLGSEASKSRSEKPPSRIAVAVRGYAPPVFWAAKYQPVSARPGSARTGCARKVYGTPYWNPAAGNDVREIRESWNISGIRARVVRARGRTRRVRKGADMPSI